MSVQLVWGLGFRGLAALGLALGLTSGAMAQETATPVEVAPVMADPGDDVVIAAGTLAQKLEVPLSFKISGVIDGIYVDEGDIVDKGQLLSQLIDTEIGARESEAAATLAQAQSDYQRAKVLADRGVLSKSALEQAETAMKRAKANLDAVKFDTRFSRIVAPAEGVVLSRRAEPGELVNAGVSVLTIGDASKGFILNVPLSDRDVVRLAPGDDAEITLSATPSLSLSATVVRLAAKADPRTGSFNAELLLDVEAGAANLLRSGMIGTAVITPRQTEKPESARVVIPADAILEASGPTGTVFVVDETNKASLRQIEVSQIRVGHIVVSKGLGEGEQVVVSGAPYLKNGMPVRIVSRRGDVLAPTPIGQ